MATFECIVCLKQRPETNMGRVDDGWQSLVVPGGKGFFCFCPKHAPNVVPPADLEIPE